VPRLVLTRVEVMGRARRAFRRHNWLLGQVSLGYRDKHCVARLRRARLHFPRAAIGLALPDGGIDRSLDRYRHSNTGSRWTNLDAAALTSSRFEPPTPDSVWSREPLRIQVHRDTSPLEVRAGPTGLTCSRLLSLIAYRARLQRTRFERVVQEQQRLESEVALRTRELV